MVRIAGRWISGRWTSATGATVEATTRLAPTSATPFVKRGRLATCMENPLAGDRRHWRNLLASNVTSSDDSITKAIACPSHEWMIFFQPRIRGTESIRRCGVSHYVKHG